MPPPTESQPPPYHWHNIHPNARISYVRDSHLANALIDTLHGPVGFDLEWKPTFTKNTPENPVAIVQLANENDIAVIQVSAMSEFPTKLRDFLENPDVVKAGVGIQNDAKKLFKDWGISLRTCIDLSLLARCADNAQWKGKYRAPLGLARLIENYEFLTLPKGRISRSNWEGQLTSKEVDYAGNDAHAGFVLYQRLSAMANALEKVPKPVYYSFNFVRGNFCEPTGMHWNCYNPDYDPGPPPPPKPIEPPTARYIRANAKAGSSPDVTWGESSPNGLVALAILRSSHPEHRRVNATPANSAASPPPSLSRTRARDLPAHTPQPEVFPSPVGTMQRDTRATQQQMNLNGSNTVPKTRRRRRPARHIPNV
ncbi:hypothetical protein H0H87_010717 [Tephrocybe sp. NHM501043]|nr:hypothetical protein H0H87_010717 [Tephrocybe sp. NHM501043]